MRSMFKPVVAVVAGALAAPYLIWVWAQIAGRGFVFDPLYGAGLRGTSLATAIPIADFFVSLVLSAPIALVIRALGVRHVWFHTVLAAIALWVGSASLMGLPGLPVTMAGLATHVSAYAALAVAVWLSLKLPGRAPNSSSKPTPLRGAA